MAELPRTYNKLMCYLMFLQKVKKSCKNSKFIFKGCWLISEMWNPSKDICMFYLYEMEFMHDHETRQSLRILTIFSIGYSIIEALRTMPKRVRPSYPSLRKICLNSCFMGRAHRHETRAMATSSGQAPRIKMTPVQWGINLGPGSSLEEGGGTKEVRRGVEQL